MRGRTGTARGVDRQWPTGLGVALAIASGRMLAQRRGVQRPALWGFGNAGAVDAGAVASWLTGQLPPGEYQGLVIGSPHGAALHLAGALGVPWLPAAFELATPDVARRSGSVGSTAEDNTAAADAGERGAGAVLAANPDVAVRQVYDPVWRGWSASAAAYAVVRWLRLPAAYRDWIADHLRPGAPIIVTRDVGRWPTVAGRPGYAFQLGSRASGLTPDDYLDRRAVAVLGEPAVDSDGEQSVDRTLVEDLRRFASAHGHPVRQILYRHPDVLSGAVADLYRTWLRAGARTGNRLVVECGRLLDPWHVIRAGLVPYWCEFPLRSAVRAASWWLAGSEPFTSVDVYPSPPGLTLPTTAPAADWDAVAAFATRHGAVDARCARAYPTGTVPPHHTTQALRAQPSDLPYLPYLDAGAALTGLADRGQTDGLLIL
ncbi:hypothetical protein Dvina_09640 [Dactylosporangium vinaceum]|uniref:Uncharacterized protein n=1 Tax=Dactylosporangium vinaceum TaxID=53362 RepID=A0ABV5MB42_9ACTN|nr:hypothetical protein [Dactylosporangium vinaceum]UAB98320.1 hypothetical protein Dvina_09640 [Dactylosporangium vinaceum]